MASWGARLRALLTGAPPEDHLAALRASGSASTAAARAERPRRAAPAGTARASAPVPAHLVALLASVPGAGTEPVRHADAFDEPTPLWSAAVAGRPALQMRDALLARAGGAPGWWPVVLLDGAVDDALNEQPGDPQELAGLTAEEGRTRLDGWWELALDDQGDEDDDGDDTDDDGAAPTPRHVLASVREELVRPLGPRPDDAVGLLPAAGAWQLPALLGWSPMALDHDAQGLSAALHHWEQRWGAELVALGEEDLVLRVASPPTSPDDAAGLARDLVATAPLTVTDDLVEPLARAADLLAPALVGARWWTLPFG